MIAWRGVCSAGFGLLLLLPRHAASFPVDGDQTVLPPGTELNEDALQRPREIFHSEYRGDRKSYQINLGDLAFNAPEIFGGVARQAGMSCATCHVNGAGNAKLFVPGMSTRPGNFDTTGPLFNPAADNHVLDPVRIPSLRGARYLAPYGHDGRMASLRDFVRNVVINEFAGPEPSTTILDAIVAYIQEIDFLPNPKLGARGRLNESASETERRGEALFSKPFPRDPNLSCAGCHLPAGAFVDHLQHDVGSGGLHKTPTLLNANFNAPYFHDGRYDSFDQVVDHFDREFGLALSAQDRGNLVAYLRAVGDGQQPYDRDSVMVRFKEISTFSLLLAQAIGMCDREAIELAVDTLGGEMRDLTERFPDHRDPAVTGALVERRLVRGALKDVVISLRRIAIAVTSGDFDAATAEYRVYYGLTFSRAMPLLRGTEPWSLFNAALREAHDTQRRRCYGPRRRRNDECSNLDMSMGRHDERSGESIFDWSGVVGTRLPHACYRRAAVLGVIVAIALASNAGAAPLEASAEGYRRYLIEDIGQALNGARTLRERVVAADLDGAKRKAWIEARIGWERSEVFTGGFVPELDQQIDAWPNANDGFHGIEVKLFGANRTDIGEETDALIALMARICTGRSKISSFPAAPAPSGVARLAFEVGGNKTDGGESRLSGTSLNDMQSNVDGIELAYRVIFSDAIGASDPRLADAARATIERIKATVPDIRPAQSRCRKASCRQRGARGPAGNGGAAAGA